MASNILIAVTEVNTMYLGNNTPPKGIEQWLHREADLELYLQRDEWELDRKMGYWHSRARGHQGLR